MSEYGNTSSGSDAEGLSTLSEVPGLKHEDNLLQESLNAELRQIRQIVLELEQGDPRIDPVYAIPDVIRDQIGDLSIFSEYYPVHMSASFHDARLQVIGAIGAYFKRKRWFCLDNQSLGIECVVHQWSLLELAALVQHSQSTTERIYLGTLTRTEGSWVLVGEMVRRSKALHTLEVLSDGYYSEIRAAGLGEIAEGLNATRPSTLQRLDLSYGAIGDEEGCRHLCTILRAAPTLKHLDLRGADMDTEIGAKLLGEALALHQSLEKLVLSPVYKRQRTDPLLPLEVLLATAFTGQNPNTSVQSLKLVGEPGPVSTLSLNGLCELLRCNNHIQSLRISGKEAELVGEELEELFECLQNNTTLKRLHLPTCQMTFMDEPLGLNSGGYAQLVKLLKFTSLQDLKLNFLHRGDDVDLTTFYTALKSNSSIRTISLGGALVEGEFLNYIETTNVLEDLELDLELDLEYEAYLHYGKLFKALRGNGSLKTLKLPYVCVEQDEDFRELMSMLSVNSTIASIDLHGQDREAIVNEALTSKARQEMYLAELNRCLGLLSRTNPKCGRVFLCGSPMAGKTRLGKTMLNLEKKSIVKRVVKYVKEKLLPRTEGIEVHTLRSDDNMEIRLWDLAGQDIFRALQEYLFPKLSKACMFVFVFSPYDQESRRTKSRLEDVFRDEFLVWLRFINSNSELTAFNLPKVLVVLSHKDKLGDWDPAWVESAIGDFIQKFKNVMKIYPKPYFIDGHNREHVKPVLRQLYTIFEDLFHERLFRIPDACCQMSRKIADWASSHRYQPLIDSTTFASLCDSVPDLRNVRETLDKDSADKLVLAVRSYLHDVGTIIDMRKSGLIVVNPNWLTHVFLGRLVGIGHDFQQSIHPKTVHHVQVVTQDGFLGGSDFQAVLRDNFLKPLGDEGYKDLKPASLQALMEDLDLCYNVPVGKSSSESQFYVPTIFKSVEAEHDLSWQVHTNSWSEYVYLGLRVRCKDQERTHLSTAFFCRFQVCLWRSLSSSLLSDQGQIHCSYNRISIHVDGHEIWVEIDKDATYIDVLVRSSKSREVIWKFVDRHIVHEMRAFCASPRGSPGVELVVDMLRMRCAQNLTPCVHRSSQAVSRDFLKKKIKRKAKQGDSDEYVHLWKGVSGANLQDENEHALEILPPPDVDAINDWVKQQVQALKAQIDRIQVVVGELCNVDSQLKTSRPVLNETSTCSPGRASREQAIVGVKGGELMHKIFKQLTELAVEVENLRVELKKVHLDVRKVLTEVKELRGEMQVMTKLQKTQLDTLSQIFKKVDHVLAISNPSNDLPRRPYFRNINVSLVHRITAKLDFGKPIILHFLCENEQQNHIVCKQTGFQLVVVEKSRDLLRVLATNTVKVLWILLKVGVHVTTGMGGLVPELEMSNGGYISLGTMVFSSLLENVGLQDNPIVVDNHDACEKAWQYLQDDLKGQLKDRVPEHFQLYRARYIDSCTHAWLCKRCLDNLLVDNKVEKL